MIAGFNVADKVTHEFYFGFVRDPAICELLFKQDQQFNNVEPIETKVVCEVRFVANEIDLDPQMPGDTSADLAGKDPSFRSRASRSQCQAGHESVPRFG
jgi:hypothetical protein